MFRSCTAFQIADTATQHLLTHDDLDETLLASLICDPGATRWSSFGFARPAEFGLGIAYDSGTGVRMLCVEKRERVLPGKVIKQHLAERIADVSKRENRKLDRRTIAQLKEDVTAELLPNTLIKASHFMVMIVQGWLFLETASAKGADDLQLFLNTALGPSERHDGPTGTLALKRLGNEHAGEWLKRVALDDVQQDYFRRLDAIVIEGGDGKMRFKDTELDDDMVTGMIIGKSVRELEMSYRRDIEEEVADLHCAINDSMVIKRIKFSNVIVRQVENDAGDEGAGSVRYFDATACIVGDLIKRVAATMNVEVMKLQAEQEDEL